MSSNMPAARFGRQNSANGQSASANPQKIEITQLPNGLPVLLCNRPSAESVSVLFGVGYGDLHSREEFGGPTAHFLEHMLFNGTKIQSREQLDVKLQEIAAYNNAYTLEEATMYFIKAQKSDAASAIELLADMTRNSVLDQKMIDLERQPIYQEYASYVTNHDRMMYDRLRSLLFAGTPSGRRAISTEAEVNKVTRDDLLKAYVSHYTPDNSVVAVFGAIPDGTLEKVREQFGSMSGTNAALSMPVPGLDLQRVEETITVNDTEVSKIMVGIKRPPGSQQIPDIDDAAQDVLVKMLNKSLFNELRTEKALAYSAGANQAISGLSAFTYANTWVSPANAATAKSAMLGILDKAQRGELDLDLFNRTKRVLERDSRLVLEDTLHSMTGAAYTYLTYGRPSTLSDYPEVLSRVSLDDVRRMAAAYLRTDKSATVTLAKGRSAP